MLFPGVLWAFCLNGFTLGVNIAIATTYSSIVTAPPYNWPNKSASYVNTAQIVVALVALPLLGNVHEPEARLLLLWIPIVVAIISAVLYGLAGQNPEKYHWFAIVFAFGGYYFGFIGANIAGITYLLDSYPARAGPVLVVITALRGFVSFGTSYGVATFIETAGYDGSFGAYAGITAILGLFGVPIFFYGKRIRQYTGKWASKERSGKPSMTH
jgi:MFS family permease